MAIDPGLMVEDYRRAGEEDDEEEVEGPIGLVAIWQTIVSGCGADVRGTEGPTDGHFRRTCLFGAIACDAVSGQ